MDSLLGVGAVWLLAQLGQTTKPKASSNQSEEPCEM